MEIILTQTWAGIGSTGGLELVPQHSVMEEKSR